MALALSLAGCAATPLPSSGDSETRSAELAKARVFDAFAEPCSLETPPNSALPPDAPEPPARVGPEPGTFTAGVFVDTALFLLRTASAEAPLPVSRESLTRDATVRLLGSPHLSASFDATSRAVLEDHTGPLAQATLHEIALTPRRTAGAELLIELETTLLLPTPQTTSGRPPEARLQLLTAPHFGQAVTLTAQIPEQPGYSLLLLLRAYEIRKEADLRAIFLCKMAQRKRMLGAPAGQSGTMKPGQARHSVHQR